MSAAGLRITQGGAYGGPHMRFTLTYDGELPATGNSSRKPESKWAIRRHISPQLAELWQIHPTLLEAERNRHWVLNESYFYTESHHLSTTRPAPRQERPGS